MKLSKQLVLPVLVMVVAGGAFASAQMKKPAASKAKVMFLEPKNNATVTSPVHMKFGSSGTTISPVPPGDPKMCGCQPFDGSLAVGVST